MVLTGLELPIRASRKGCEWNTFPADSRVVGKPETDSPPAFPPIRAKPLYVTGITDLLARPSQPAKTLAAIVESINFVGN